MRFRTRLRGASSSTVTELEPESARSMKFLQPPGAVPHNLKAKLTYIAFLSQMQHSDKSLIRRYLRTQLNEKYKYRSDTI